MLHQLLATASWTVISMTSAIIEAEMYVEVNKLSNNSADGYFNVPEFDPCERNFLHIYTYKHIYIAIQYECVHVYLRH